MLIFQVFIFDIKLHFYRRYLSQKPNVAIYSHLRYSEVPEITKMLMTSSCFLHAGAIFYNLGLKNQARKFKFGFRDVHMNRSSIYSVFVVEILNFMITF